MFMHLRSVIGGAALLLTPALAAAQVYVAPAAVPYPGSAQAATSQVYHYFNGVPYYQGFYYPGPAGTYPGLLDELFRTPTGFDIPNLIVITPVVPSSATEAVVATVPTPATETATLDIRLPADAELYLQGRKSSQTGSERYFVTPPLAQGQTFTCRIKAIWREDGRDREVVRTIVLASGDHSSLTLLGE
jgi:uncharacterized protein (TIGR03000 family)